MKNKILKYLPLSCFVALHMIWLVPWALERNYRIMKYFGERIERMPGPTKTTNE